MVSTDSIFFSLNPLASGSYSFSILIPSWNNLPFLKLCVESIRANSGSDHEIILHLNEGSDGSLDWAQSNVIKFSFSEKNTGVCKAVNEAAKLATRDILVFMNDDMFCLPGWDLILSKGITEAGTGSFMVSSTMIEPVDTGNSCVMVKDFGTDPLNFRKEKIMKEFQFLNKKDWNGSSWPPVAIHRKLWNEVGGFSEEFSPGMSSDNDLAMKLWKAGVRYFRGMGESKVYHFQAKSTGRIVKNNGRKQFLQKWGLSQSVFYRYYLKMGSEFKGGLKEPGFSPGLLFGLIRSKIKKLLW